MCREDSGDHHALTTSSPKAIITGGRARVSIGPSFLPPGAVDPSPDKQAPTASLKPDQGGTGSVITADGNIVHSRATLRYRVDDPVKYAFDFTSSSNSVQDALDNALVFAASRFTVDDILTRQVSAFRAAVEGILNVATTIDDRYALEDHLSSQRVVLQSAVKDLRMTLDEIRVTSVPARNARCCPPSPLRRARRERSPVQLRIAELSDDRIGQVRFVRYG